MSGLLWGKLVTFLGPGTDTPDLSTNGKQLVWQRFSLAFCAFAGLLTLHWSWGLQVWVWTRFRIVSSFVLQTTPFEKQCIEE